MINILSRQLKKNAKWIACVFKRKTITTPFYIEVSTKKLGQGKFVITEKIVNKIAGCYMLKN